MIEQLVTRVFTTRNLAHLAHWKTKSYAQHMALGDFYDALIDQIDNIVESYQGAFGLLSIDAAPQTPASKDITKHLEQELIWIANNREKIAKNVAALENLIDALTETYMRTLYKLKNLS